jgi:hypothetical protein
MTTILPIVQTLDYVLLLILLSALWVKVVRRQEIRAFWFLLASALTTNFLGNIAWILHDMTTDRPLGAFSFIDLFYVLRYVLVGFALWAYPLPLNRKAGVGAGFVTIVVNALIWMAYFPPAMKLHGGDWMGFLGLAMYPAFDAALIMLAWFRLRSLQRKEQVNFFLFLFFSMLFYGIANILNLAEYIFLSSSSGVLPAIFWILADVFLLVIAFRKVEPTFQNNVS